MGKLQGAALLVAVGMMGCNARATPRETAAPTTVVRVGDDGRATTGEAVAPTVNRPVHPTTYAFDDTSSTVAFVGAKVTGQHDGSFGAFRGKVRATGTELEKGSVRVEIDTASVTTDNSKLTAHLKSSDFFAVDEFPKATFRSTSVEKSGAAGATHTIHGDLTLHGITRRVSFPARVALESDTMNVDAEFEINRKDFGVLYSGMVDNAIRDEVLIKLTIRAKKS